MSRKSKISSKKVNSPSPSIRDGSAISILHEDSKHERDRRYTLTDSVRNQLKYIEAFRAKDRAVYALKHLQFESDVRSLVEELSAPLREIS